MGVIIIEIPPPTDNDTHLHVCCNGHSWTHTYASQGDRDAHLCQKCGEPSWIAGDMGDYSPEEWREMNRRIDARWLIIDSLYHRVTH